MVCQRCINAVQQAAELAKISLREIRLGELTTEETDIAPERLEKFDRILINLGFERFEDKKTRLVETVKMLVIEQIHHKEDELKMSWSNLIADKLNFEYNYISNVFSASEGITIEQFIIRQKIEKIMEMLSYDEYPLSEIAYRLGYSSPSYLINQFKKYTGMTPRQYAKLIKKNRNPLDQL